LLLSGCISNAAPDQAAVSPTTGDIYTNTPLPFPTATATPTATLTLAITSTPIQTPTATITSTPTLVLPIHLTDGFLKPSKPITVENIADIRELAYFGTPIVYEVRISQDGKMGYAITSTGIGVYDTASQKLERFFPVASCSQRYASCSSKNAISISNDGSRFAILANESIQVWDIDGYLRLEVPVRNPIYVDISLSPNGKLLAETNVEGSEIVNVYDINRNEKLNLPSEMRGSYCSFSPGGTWLTIWNYFQRGVIWRTADWSKEQNLFFTSNQVEVGFSGDDRLIVMQGSELTSIYQIEDWKLIREIPIKNDQWQRTQHRYFSPSSKIFAVVYHGYNRSKQQSETFLRIWNINSGEFLQEVKLEPGQPRDYIIHDDGTYSTNEAVGEILDIIQVTRSDYYEGKQWRSFRPKVYFYPQGDRFWIWKYRHDMGMLSKINEFCTIQSAVSMDCMTSSDSISITENRQILTLLPTETEGIYTIDLESDGRSDLIGKFNHSRPLALITPLWLSPDNQFLLLEILSTDYTQDLELWNIQSETRIGKWKQTKIPFFEYDINTKAGLLAFSTVNRRVIYNYLENRTILEESFDNWSWGGITIADDGNVIYASEINDPFFLPPDQRFQIYLLDVNTLKKIPLTDVLVSDLSIHAIAQSPDGRFLIIGTPEGYIRVYEMSTGEQIYMWQAHTRCIKQLEFSPDGTFLVSHSEGCQNGGDGLLKVWGVWP
jgi:WD40 repeat protein